MFSLNLLCWWTLCTCWGLPSMLWQAVCNFVLAFTSRFCRASRSARDPEHAHSLGHICGFLDSWEFVNVFQSLLWRSPYPTFPVRFYGLLVMFVLAIITASSTCYAKQLLLIVFEKTKTKKQGKLFTLGELWVKSNRQALWMEFSRKVPDRSNEDSSLGMGLWEEIPTLFFLPLWLIGCWFSSGLQDCWFSRLLWR